MKTIKILSLLLGFGLISSNQLAAENKDDNKNKAQTEAFIPVSTFKSKTSPKTVEEYRKAYRSKDWLINGDVATYAFKNIPEFYTTATVYRGAGQVAMLEKEVDESLWNTMTDTPSLGQLSLSELVKDKDARMQGVMVIHDGKIVLEEYMGMRELDKHSWFSASKQLIGMSVHILEEEGLIDLEQSVNHYLPEFDSPDWKKVKVKHLLHHVSGMDYVESNTNFMNPEHPLNKAVKYSLSTRWEDAGESVFDLMNGVKSHIEPGVCYEYSSMNTQILGFIVERVTNSKFEDVLSERVWTKTGMESDGHYGMSGHGEPLTAGFYASRLRDFARFGLLYTPSWNLVADEPIVSDTYWEKVYDQEFAPAFDKGEFGQNLIKNFDGKISHASYQWDAVFEDGDLFKGGRYGQGIYVSPETNTVVVYFSAVHQNLTYFADFARQIVKQNYR